MAVQPQFIPVDTLVIPKCERAIRRRHFMSAEATTAVSSWQVKQRVTAFMVEKREQNSGLGSAENKGTHESSISEMNSYF